jgi:nicotinate-nucleotide adenylyltransferase
MRGTPTYTVETLRGLRAELGPDASIVFLMGADQLQNLDSWRDWQQLFALANIGVAARPGYTLDRKRCRPRWQRNWRRDWRHQNKCAPRPPAWCAWRTAWRSISRPRPGARTTARRRRSGTNATQEVNSLVPPVVLDYIQQHNLYKS